MADKIWSNAITLWNWFCLSLTSSVQFHGIHCNEFIVCSRYIAFDREVAKCKSMPNASIKYTKWYIPTKEYVSHHIYNHFKVQTFRQTIIYFFTFVKCSLLHTALPVVSFSMSHINFWLCICIENALPGKPEKIWKIKDMDQNERLSVQNVDCLSGKQCIHNIISGRKI